MANRSYEELHEIVGKLRDEYNPEAVAAAEAEVEKRNILGEKIHPIGRDLRSRKQLKAEKANEPLQTQWKILTLLFPGILNLIMADALKANGYERQYQEIWKWFFYGLGFYVMILLIVIILAFIQTS